tara:strand:+ start:619 stop:1125 length:507 start_codon:yes stop_codon:yes gene_type:complete
MVIFIRFFYKKTLKVENYLIGVYNCKVDSKGRLMIPIQLKKQLSSSLGASFILKRSVFHRCLELFAMNSWNNVVADINKLNRFVKKNNDFIRMFTAGVKMIDLDSNGRLLIPKELKQYANIKNEVVLSSSGNMIELWNTNDYESTVNNSELDFSSMAEDVMGNINNTE